MDKLIWRIAYIYHLRKQMPYISGAVAYRMSKHITCLYLAGYTPQAVAKWDKEKTEGI